MAASMDTRPASPSRGWVLEPGFVRVALLLSLPGVLAGAAGLVRPIGLQFTVLAGAAFLWAPYAIRRFDDRIILRVLLVGALAGLWMGLVHAVFAERAVAVLYDPLEENLPPVDAGVRLSFLVEGTLLGALWGGWVGVLSWLWRKVWPLQRSLLGIGRP